MGLKDFLNPLSPTPAEKARMEGTLVYDEEEDRWIDLTQEDDPR
jgi:hypothetical protein